MSSKRRSNNLWDAVVQADLLPVMNIMFLLIPALLLAMEFASMAEINVSPPKMCATCGEAANTPKTPALEYKVMIRSDGFAPRTGSGPLPEIPLRSGELDYEALAAATKALKSAHPDEVTVTVTAENDVPMAKLVQTLDTLRGDGCKLAPVRQGEQPGSQCLFFSSIIES
jgi:biopolymer transport protein ExbD